MKSKTRKRNDYKAETVPFFSVYNNPQLGLNINFDPRRNSQSREVKKRKFRRPKNHSLQGKNHLPEIKNDSSIQPDTLEPLYPGSQHDMNKSTGFQSVKARGILSPTSQAEKSPRRFFDPANSTIQDLTSMVDARKMRNHRENEVRKLHNRIQMLQLEEDRALKRIEETRKKAQQMLDYKIQ